MCILCLNNAAAFPHLNNKMQIVINFDDILLLCDFTGCRLLMCSSYLDELNTVVRGGCQPAAPSVHPTLSPRKNPHTISPASPQSCPAPPYAAQKEGPPRRFTLIEGETKIPAYFLVTHFL